MYREWLETGDLFIEALPISGTVCLWRPGLLGTHAGEIVRWYDGSSLVGEQVGGLKWIRPGCLCAGCHKLASPWVR